MCAEYTVYTLCIYWLPQRMQAKKRVHSIPWSSTQEKAKQIFLVDYFFTRLGIINVDLLEVRQRWNKSKVGLPHAVLFNFFLVGSFRKLPPLLKKLAAWVSGSSLVSNEYHWSNKGRKEWKIFNKKLKQSFHISQMVSGLFSKIEKQGLRQIPVTAAWRQSKHILQAANAHRLITD